MKRKTITPRMLSIAALLVALQIVLSKLTQIPLLDKEYNLGFLAIAIAAWTSGPLVSVIVAILGDVLGSILFPTGAFFPGFTLTAALVGLTYGLFLNSHDKEQLLSVGTRSGYIRIILAVFCSECINWLLNSVWISVMYTHKLYGLQLIARAPTYLIEIPFQMVVLLLVLSLMNKTRILSVIRGK